jgi:sulfate permease, SulP family
MSPVQPHFNRCWFCQSRWFQLSQILPDLLVGLTTGAVGVLFDLSFAALIFSDRLSQHLAVGVGLVLLSAAITRTMTALMSSYPGVVADLGTVPTAILAWSTGAIAKQLPVDASATELLITIVVTIALTTFLTGAFLFLLGILRVGEMVRLVPQPVVGGFVASTGWLLVKGGLKVMTGISLNFNSLIALAHPDQLIRWLPGLILSIYLLALSQRRSHPYVMSASLFAAVGLFYTLLSLSGTSLAQASTQGWTLGVTLTHPPSWQFLSPSAFTQIHWPMIADQIPCMLTVVMVTVISLLLNISGLELVTDREMDVNRELKVAGIANLTIGLGGGILSYHSLSKSVLAQKMGSRSRRTTLITAAVFLGFPFLGVALLSYCPKLLLGGLLLFLGLSLLIEWVYKAWFKLPKSDYFLVLLILVISGAVGFLQGLIVGWVMAAVLFVITYSRIHRTQPGLSGRNCPSSRLRSTRDDDYLRRQGNQIYILEPQGCLFFGTANSLVNQIQQHIIHTPQEPVRFIMLNFRLVSDLDTSALHSFFRLRHLMNRHALTLVFTNLRPNVERKLQQAGFLTAEQFQVREFCDFDQGLAWCEDQILANRVDY